MRLIQMNRIALAAALLLVVPVSLPAQYSAPPNSGSAFKDTSMVKPPAGARVAIYEFEDLECPACAHTYPIVHAAAERYKIPIVRHDFPLKMHIWSFDAAVIARYIQDKIDPKLAEEYRRSVFASQTAIASKEDLNNFSQKFFQSHGHPMPFVIDPSGLFAAEIRADYTLGERIGLSQTPTIFVVTQKNWVQVTDISQLYQTIDNVMAQTPPVATTASKTTTKTKTAAHK
ncbi:MAG TPA: thioredoxin domain-containing protein [Edaphobacter sp.]|nr:thioredoxin domain-containing protein [Edaphobacter sp.]